MAQFLARKRALALMAAGVVLVLPATAQAAPRTISFDYYCKSADGNGNTSGGSLECSQTEAKLENPTGPSFNPQPEPTITTYGIVISYDPTAGTLSYTQTQPDATYAYDPQSQCEGGNQQDLNDDCDGYYTDSDGDQDRGPQYAANWADTGKWELSDGRYTPGAATSTTVTFEDDAEDNGDGGPSGYSDAWADWNSPTSEVGQSPDDLYESGVRSSLKPTVTLSGSSITLTWTSSYLQGLNLTEVQSGSDGLGVPFGFGGYFPGDEPVLPLPRLAGDMKISDEQASQIRPFTFDYITGDGSAVVGGANGHTFVPRRLNDIGKIDWTSWGYRIAVGHGRIWGIYGGGCNACSHTWQNSGPVTLTAYDSVGGLFRKMTVRWGAGLYRTPGKRATRYRAVTERLNLTEFDGYYTWQIT